MSITDAEPNNLPNENTVGKLVCHLNLLLADHDMVDALTALNVIAAALICDASVTVAGAETLASQFSANLAVTIRDKFAWYHSPQAVQSTGPGGVA